MHRDMFQKEHLNVYISHLLDSYFNSQLETNQRQSAAATPRQKERLFESLFKQWTTHVVGLGIKENIYIEQKPINCFSLKGNF